jgi:hypothetical protein
MPYEMKARSDRRYSKYLDTETITSVLRNLPDTHLYGPKSTDWVFERDDKLFMEIDVELVDEHGELLLAAHKAGEANCIRFCIPHTYLQEEHLAECRAYAQGIADRLGWLLYAPLPDGADLRGPDDWSKVQTLVEPDVLELINQKMGSLKETAPAAPQALKKSRKEGR